MLDEIAGEVEIHGKDSKEENNAEHGGDEKNTIGSLQMTWKDLFSRKKWAEIVSVILKKYLRISDNENPVSNKNQHVVFFDNFFTSHQILTTLAEENTRTCGTVRDNRIGHFPLLSKNECKRKPRGTYDFRSDRTVVCVKWNDNCTVTIASNYYGVFPIQKVERRVKHEHKKTVDQPYLIQMDNQGMGGVDICDIFLASYRPRL
ncbi:unnamed protein product [Lepeophtheirus salmonis]|uniref:(salmon louse) hypothetical protein n=1 Tax=Lepeophtheirus salmonis TaxID=72036 RepID=A0A7R8H4V1_LEPSM|nr:unnamed protein product [Lepeophtheirus salmonis]CAF2851923.1 unnamed protein product [Lepeophtheirus salmonis]